MEINAIKMMLQLQSLKQVSAAGIQSPFASSPFAMILEQLFEAAGIMPEQTTAGSQERLNVPAFSQQEQLPVMRTTAPLASKPHQDIHQLIDQISSKYNMNPALITSIVQHESGFNPMSKSPAGAMGLMQLMPETARGLGSEIHIMLKTTLKAESNTSNSCSTSTTVMKNWLWRHTMPARET